MPHFTMRVVDFLETAYTKSIESSRNSKDFLYKGLCVRFVVSRCIHSELSLSLAVSGRTHAGKELNRGKQIISGRREK